MKIIKLFTILFAIAIINQSCRNDEDVFTFTPPVIEPEIKVVSSVLGTVLDNDGNAVVGASVTFEDQITFTDDNGIFQFIDQQLYADGTFIKVEKDGYFNGSRKFYASVGKTSRVVIELIPKIEVADFNSSEGSIVSFENVEIVFEPDNIMNADGTPFSGNVNIAAKYLDPSLQHTLNQMPGDLTGIANDQNRVVLTSMAMMAVELSDDNGNELQVKDGNAVDTKIPIPSSLQGIAPSTIPMWYFDEEDGTWIEEGSAQLVEGMYETSLAHFTFWNCDIPNDFIFLKGRIVNREYPIQDVRVVVTTENGGLSASTVTDNEGFFCGFVPLGEDLILEVFDKCGDVIYSFNIPASEEDIVLEPFNLFLDTNIATITGFVTACNGSPSPETYVSVRQGSLNNVIAINEDFTFESNVFYCDNNEELFVSAVDPVNVVISDISTFSISTNIDAGAIQLCEDNGQLIDPRDGEKYLIVEIDGKTWTAENMRFDTDDGISGGYDVSFSSVPYHYGRLYNWYSAQEVCPTGWHIPSDSEFEDLVSFLGTSSTSGFALKSTEDWVNGGNGSNSSGFNAFPVGIVTKVDDPLDYTGQNAAFWTSIKGLSSGRGLVLNSDNNDANVSGSTLELAFSVRCVKD